MGFCLGDHVIDRFIEMDLLGSNLFIDGVMIRTVIDVREVRVTIFFLMIFE